MLTNEVQKLVFVIVLAVVCKIFPSGVANTIFVKLGSDASFVCPHHSSQEEVIWRGPRHLSLYSTNTIVDQARPQFNKIKITGNFTAGEYNMIIKNFSKVDEGLYACDTIKNGKGVQHFISALVAEKPGVIGNQRNLIVKTKLNTKTRFSILVNSYEKPEINWAAMYEGGKRGYWEIYQLNGTVFEASSVIIPQLKSHLGNYGLKIRNSAGSIQINIRLITSMLHISHTSAMCNASEAVNLSCYLNSKKVEHLVSNEWIHTYHGVKLRTFQGIIKHNISTLSINFCVHKDAGNYSCKWNLDGQQYSATASVTVNSYPLFVKKRITSINRHLSLEIIFYSNPRADNITWYHNENIVKGNKKYLSSLNEVTTELSFYGQTIKTSAYSAVLSLSNFTQGLEHGVYSCHIKNLFGFIEESFDEKDIANATAPDDRSMLSGENDIHNIMLITLCIACSAVVAILFTSIGMIMSKSRRIEISQSHDLNEENNTTQDVSYFSHQHHRSSILNLDNRFNEYEEIESIATAAEEQDIHFSSDSSDDTETLTNEVCTAAQPTHVYDQLDTSAIELHMLPNN